MKSLFLVFFISNIFLYWISNLNFMKITCWYSSIVWRGYCFFENKASSNYCFVVWHFQKAPLTEISIKCVNVWSTLIIRLVFVKTTSLNLCTKTSINKFLLAEHLSTTISSRPDIALTFLWLERAKKYIQGHFFRQFKPAKCQYGRPRFPNQSLSWRFRNWKMKTGPPIFCFGPLKGNMIRRFCQQTHCC